MLKFSSMLHSIPPYPNKFRAEAARNLYCTFATLSVLLQEVAHEGKQYDTMHLTPYLKHYCNDLTQNLLSIKISTIGVAKIFDWGGKTQITCNGGFRNFQNEGFLWDRDTVEWKVRSRGLCVWTQGSRGDFGILLKGKTFNQNLWSFPKMSSLGDVVS